MFWAICQNSVVYACENCDQCCGIVKKNLGLKVLTEDVLKKNQYFLAKLDKSEASKRIKVNSNILVSQIQIETLQQVVATAQDGIKAKGCTACEPQIKN